MVERKWNVPNQTFKQLTGKSGRPTGSTPTTRLSRR